MFWAGQTISCPIWKQETVHINWEAFYRCEALTSERLKSWDVYRVEKYMRSHQKQMVKETHKEGMGRNKRFKRKARGSNKKG